LIRDAGIPLPVVAGAAADAVPVIADLVFAAAIAAGPAVVAIVVGISAVVRDALVVLAMFVRAAADRMALIADLVLAALHPAGAAVRVVALQAGADVAASRVAVVAGDGARDPAVVRGLAGVVFAGGAPRRRARDACVPTTRVTRGANEERRRSCQPCKSRPAL